jgi:hypothetical protein
MILDRALTWFINGWVGLIVILNIIAIVGMFLLAPTIWAGIAKILATYSPWNPWNLAAEVISLSPAIGAHVWRERRRNRGRISN